MRNTRSLKAPDMWAQRHRVQHATKKALDPRTSKRFAGEFERAVKARGDEAKKLAEDAALYGMLIIHSDGERVPPTDFYTTEEAA